MHVLPPFRSILAALIAPLLCAPLLSAQGVRFTIAPSGEYVWWNDALPLKHGTLLGARVGADFGKLIGVTGWYHRGKDIPIAFSGTPLRAGGEAFVDGATDVETYGASLQFKLGVGAIVPFVHGGAGVIRFRPDGAERTDQVNYRYGGGLQYDASRNIRATVLVEDSRFRLAPERLSSQTPDVPTSDPRASLSNWTASAAIGFALGGTRGGSSAGADRWSFASIPIEPFLGRLEFSDDGMERQVVAGVRAGIDFGNYFGLRGVYWQGRSDDLRERERIQAYGAEAQFNLNAGLGLAPFLVAGAHRLDYGSDYRDGVGRVLADETALVLGGGVGLRLTDNFRLNVSARDFIRTGQDFDDVASVDELTHNWMLSAGFGFSLGRSRDRDGERDRGDARDRERDRDRAGMDDDERWDRAMRDREREKGDTARRQKGDTIRGRTILIPVPENGELYVRYGAASTLRERLMARDTLATAGMTATETDLLIRALSARIDSLQAQLRAMPAGRVPAPGVVGRDSARIPTVVVDSARTIRGASGYVAGFDALVLGVQLDAGPLFGVEALRLVPEFAIGLHGDKSVLFSVGGEYRFRPFTVSGTRTLRPHARLGLGLLAAGGDTHSQFGFNVAYGVTFEPRDPSSTSRAPKVFLEHQGIGFFSVNRLAAGLRWRF